MLLNHHLIAVSHYFYFFFGFWTLEANGPLVACVISKYLELLPQILAMLPRSEISLVLFNILGLFGFQSRTKNLHVNRKK